MASDARLARFLRSTGEPSLDALQARSTADPGWFWDAAADDIAVAWTRRPREIVDLSGGARGGGGGGGGGARLGGVGDRRVVRLVVGRDRAASGPRSRRYRHHLGG